MACGITWHCSTLAVVMMCISNLDAMEQPARKKSWQEELCEQVVNIFEQESKKDPSFVVTRINKISEALRITDPTILAMMVYEVLTKARVSILDIGSFNKTLLHHAAWIKNEIAIKTVLKLAEIYQEHHGQDGVWKFLWLADDDQHTGLYYAVASGNHNHAKLICDVMLNNCTTKDHALIFSKDIDDGKTLLHVAAECNDTAMLTVLLDVATKVFGANQAWNLLFQCEKKGKTAWYHLTKESQDIMYSYNDNNQRSK